MMHQSAARKPATGFLPCSATCRAVILALLPLLASAQPKKEEPVGVVLAAAGGKLLRANTETPLDARTGDVLFSGDTLRSETAPATFLFCPGRSSQTLDPKGEALLESAQIKVRSGTLSGKKPVASCFLPQLVRVASASQQHYGVSMTRGLGGPGDAPALEGENIGPEAAAEFAPYDAALKEDPGDQVALLGRAAAFEKHKLPAHALAEYRKVASGWKDAVWVRGKIFELEEALAAAVVAKRGAELAEGKTLVLLVGVSKYQKLPQELWLQYAHADAQAFQQYFRSPRGGGIPQENMLVLTDTQASTAGLRNGLQTILSARATKKDTVIILIAAHATIESPGRKEAYILTHDSDPQDLASTAISLAEIQKLLGEKLREVGRLILFVDVCRAGQIGSIRSNTVNSSVETLGDSEGEILGLMASRPKELSFEGPEFGGGHGTFSYFVLKALNGEADTNKDGIVSVNELIEYVRDKVAESTKDRQHPRDFGAMDNALPLSDTRKPGIELTGWPVLYDLHGGPLYLAGPAVDLPQQPDRELERFSESLRDGRILPADQNNAFDGLAVLRSRLSDERYLQEANRLRVALEDRAQQVLLRYLEGDERPQQKQDFESGARHMSAALRLTPESLYLEGRQAFFEGRSLLFDKRYAEAAEKLERSIRLDPGGAYAYNALGIAYLEQADYQRAIPAFRDAGRMAVHWAYPLHNLALAYSEAGNYEAAIDTYRQAIRLMPDYSYLHYNLGLLYQRLNRRREAEAAYKSSLALSPASPESYNALGTLYAGRGKSKEAEKFYRRALEKRPGMTAARHNLAELLARQGSRFDEAVSLWKENLAAAPDYLPSRLSLAEGYAGRGDTKAAAAEYEEIMRLKPGFAGARLAYANLMLKAGDASSAQGQLQQIVKSDPENAAAWERIGDLEAAANRGAEARSAYEAAAGKAADGGSQKRIRRKLKRVASE